MHDMQAVTGRAFVLSSWVGPALVALAAAGCGGEGASGHEASPVDGGSGETGQLESGPPPESGTEGATALEPPDSATPDGPGDDNDASPPAGFWDSSNIPPAKNVMMFKFLNRTNGKYA